MPQSPISKVEWPAVVKLHQDSELIFLEHQQDWLELACTHQHHFTAEDLLLDSCGFLYQIDANPLQEFDDPVGQLPQLIAKADPLPLTDFIKWVQEYAQALGQCCIAKLAFTSISQGMNIVRSLDE